MLHWLCWNPIRPAPAGVPKLDPELTELVDSVLEAYGGDTGYALDIRTRHEPPWLAARGNLLRDAESNALIKLEAMTEFFGSLVAADNFNAH